MTYLALKRWSGQFSPRVVARIRRTIAGRIANGECLVVVDEGAEGLTPSIQADITRGWSPTQVRFSHAHPSAKPLSPVRRRPQPPGSK